MSRKLFTLSVATAIVAAGSFTESGLAQRSRHGSTPVSRLGHKVDKTRFGLVSQSQAIGGQGGLAAVSPLLAECFETFNVAALNGQNGWAVGGTAPTTTVDVVAGALGGGAKFVEVGTAATGGPTLVGSPIIGPSADDRFSATVTARLTGLGASTANTVEFQYFDAGGTLTNRFRVVGSTGAIEVRDLNATCTGFVWVATGQTVAANTAFTIRMEYDPHGDDGCQNGVTRYYRDGSTAAFYVGNGTGGLAYDAFQVQKANALPAVQFDCLTVDRRWGSCEADVAAFDGEVNVTDLLAVIGGWGACPAGPPSGCPADTNADATVNVTDLLAIIGVWGPCTTPTGGCCANAACTTTTFDACLALTATSFYLLNDSLCTGAICPDPLDNCADALAITTTPFTDVPRDPDWYTQEATDPAPCASGAFTKSGGWWYSYTVPATGVSSLNLLICPATATIEDTLIGVYPAPCASATDANQLGCSDDDCEAIGFGRSQILGLPVTPGQQLLIFISSYGGGGSNGDGSFEPVTFELTTNP